MRSNKAEPNLVEPRPTFFANTPRHDPDTKRRHPKAKTTALEREIDQMVYKLYGLTPEEIAIVEGKS